MSLALEVCLVHEDIQIKTSFQWYAVFIPVSFASFKRMSLSSKDTAVHTDSNDEEPDTQAQLDNNGVLRQ